MWLSTLAFGSLTLQPTWPQAQRRWQSIWLRCTRRTSRCAAVRLATALTQRGDVPEAIEDEILRHLRVLATVRAEAAYGSAEARRSEAETQQNLLLYIKEEVKREDPVLSTFFAAGRASCIATARPRMPRGGALKSE